jgi:hypothetical protein
MEKGYWPLLLSLMTLMIVSVGLVNAFVCSDGSSPTECVCGHTPNSLMGFGQVIINGIPPTIISCKNAADGVCPEDFKDPATNLVGNCSHCADPDCVSGGPSGSGYVWGYVHDATGNLIGNAKITGSPPKTDISASLERSTFTLDYGINFGQYNYSGFLTGTYDFLASKEGYDSEVKTVTVVRNVVTYVNFTLLNGTCHSDCTNSRNRCAKECDGLSFSDGTCNFYKDPITGFDARNTCDNVASTPGNEILIDDYPLNNATHKYYINCCEGIPFAKYNAKANIGEVQKKNRIIIQKIIMYNNKPSVLMLAYEQ